MKSGVCVCVCVILTQMSALVVISLPLYRFTISGARYERVVYLHTQTDRQTDNI